MKLPRPYIPYEVRAAVAERQADAKGFRPDAKLAASVRLRLCLIFLFGEDSKFHLDHNPALCNRAIYSKSGEFLRYEPDANHPDFLIYRNSADHRIKTIVRGDGAQRSDFAQRRYLKRLGKKSKSTFKPRRTKQIRRVK